MTRILVTGAAGFIGYHFCSQLLDLPEVEVLGLDNLNAYYDPALKMARLANLGINPSVFVPHRWYQGKESFSFQVADIQDAAALERVFQNFKPTKVVHLAAQVGVRYSMENPEAYVQTNLVGFCNLLESCRRHRVEHLVYASSSSVYGLNEAIPYQESRPADHPISLYGATKRSNELLAHSYSHLYHLPVTGLRFFTVYGPWNRPDMAAFLFTDAIFKGKTIRLFNQGKMERDWTFVGDIAKGIQKVLSTNFESGRDFDAKSPQIDHSSAPFRIFNIGSGKPVSLLDFVNQLEKTTGLPAQIELAPYQAGDLCSTHADTQSLETATGFRPQTSLQMGIEELVSWYRQYFQKNSLRPQL